MAGRARLLAIIGVPLLLLVGVILAVNLLGGGDESGTGGDGSSGGKRGGTLTLGVAEEPDTLDPQKTNLGVPGAILTYAGDTLVAKTPRSCRPSPSPGRCPRTPGSTPSSSRAA